LTLQVFTQCLVCVGSTRSLNVYTGFTLISVWNCLMYGWTHAYQALAFDNNYECMKLISRRLICTQVKCRRWIYITSVYAMLSLRWIYTIVKRVCWIYIIKRLICTQVKCRRWIDITNVYLMLSLRWIYTIVKRVCWICINKCVKLFNVRLNARL